jgi:arsenate reductase
MNTVKIYGIKNCSTMKKAMSWLEEHNIAFDFHDYKKSDIDQQSLESWLSKTSWEELINKRGTTWRKLPEESKENIDNEKAIRLMLENTSLIKRPALLVDDSLHLGFKEDTYSLIFKK